MNPLNLQQLSMLSFMRMPSEALPSLILTHFGMWMQPERQRPLGPALTPPLDAPAGLLYAQGIKTVRRRCLVRGSHRVVFGTLAAVNEVLAERG